MEVNRVIFYGMHLHISVVQNDRRVYLQILSNTVCQRLHETGTLPLGGSVIIFRASPNSTITSSINLAESTTMDERYFGTQYSDMELGTRWLCKLLLKSSSRTSRSWTCIITFNPPFGPTIRCQTRGMPRLGEQTFWSVVLQDSCQFDRYDILYEDTAIKLTPRSNHTISTVFMVITQETTFVLAKTTEFNLCRYIMTQTEYPKLFILETQQGRTFKTRSKISVNNLDIPAYINSKFV